MDKINELKNNAYVIATDKCGPNSYNYNPSTRSTAMIAYALLTIAEKISTTSDKEDK